MEEVKQPSMAAEFKTKCRKIVQLSSGLSVEICKLGRVDFLRAEVNWIQPASDQKVESKSGASSNEKFATMT